MSRKIRYANFSTKTSIYPKKKSAYGTNIILQIYFSFLNFIVKFLFRQIQVEPYTANLTRV